MATRIMGADEVLLSEHGGAMPRRITVAGVQASWELSGVGAFSAYVTLADLRAAGVAGDVQDMWLSWRHPRAGVWGGVVTGRPIDDGMAELSGEGWAGLLRGRAVPDWDRPADGAAAAMARRVVLAGGGIDGLWLSFGSRDESGAPIALAIGSQDVLEDGLLALSEQSDLEWTVDETRHLHLGRHIGRDRSASVRLVEGRHVAAYRLADDAYARPPDELWAAESTEDQLRTTDPAAAVPVHTAGAVVVLRAAHPHKGRRRHDQRRRDHSRDQHRVHHEADKRRRGKAKKGGTNIVPVDVVTWVPVPPPWSDAAPGVGARTTAIPSGHFLPPPTTPVELTVTNVDNIWPRLGLGDTVRLDLGSAGFSGRFRIMTKGIDAAAGELVLAGEAMNDEL